jgi:DNA modification methylase
VSKELDRNYIGYEVYKTYEEVIREKLGLTNGGSL